MSSSALSLRPRPAVLADLIPGEIVRDIALIAAGAAFVGALAQVTIHLSFTPVLVTGQTLGVIVAGCALGSRRGFCAMLLYLLAGLIGVPWFNAHLSGWQGASTGYLFGFIAAAFACGWLAERGADRRVSKALLAMVVGEVIVFIFGVTWLAIDLHVSISKAIALGLTPFLWGEAIKIAVATGLLPGAWWLVGFGNSSHKADDASSWTRRTV